MISYEDLLNIFWSSHYPYQPAFSRQYKSLIFYHNEKQKQIALSSLNSQENKDNKKVYTEIIPFEKFYIAEDYHQKYYLQQNQDLSIIIRKNYDVFADFFNSTLAARVNGYAGGYDVLQDILVEIDKLEISNSEKEKVIELLNDY